MPQIVQSYQLQTIPTETWLINNSGYDSFGADRLIAIPWNAGEMARYLFTRRAETEYVCFQDDDFIMADKMFLEDAIREHAERKAICIGTAGRHIQPSPPHYQPEAKPDTYTNFLKGHFQLFRREDLKNLHVCYHPFASDIWFSMDVGHTLPVHWVSAKLRVRLEKMPQHDTGLEFRPGHWEERERACADYIKEYGYASI